MSSSIPTSRGLDAPKSKGRRTYRHLSLGEEENDDDPLVQRDEDQGGNEPRLPRHDDDDEDGHCITMDDAIERLGVGPFQYRVLVCSGLCFAADGMQIVLLSFLTLVLQKEWSLSDEATAALTSTLFAGAMLGTLVLGPLADTRGRRPVFLLAAAVISGFGFLLAVVNHYVAVAVAIFGVGIGIGGLTVPFDILAEFLPAEHRGTHLLLIEYFWTVGCLYVVGVAYVTLHYLGTWRGFVALSALPSLAALIAGYLYVPESARWLHSQGKTDEALEILKLAAGENGCDVHFLYPDQIVLQPEEDEVESTCTDLFLPKWRGITLRLWGAWMGFAFGYYGAIMATTRVFSTSSDSSDSTEDFDYGAIFISSFAEVVGTTLVILVIDRWGRIPLQVVSYSVAGIALALLCMLAGGSSSFSSARLPLVSLGFTTRVFEMVRSISVRRSLVYSIIANAVDYF